MAMFVADVGKRYCADSFTSRSVPDGWTIGLYTNILAETPGRVLADFAAATFSGYTPLALGAFNAASIDANDRAAAVPTVNSFTFTRSTTGTAQAVIGYYIFFGSTLIGFEAFPSPFTFSLAGDALTLTYTYTQFTDPGPV